MSEMKASILVELQDKFSKSFGNLQRAFEGSKTKGIALSRSLKNIAKDFITGGREAEEFKKKLGGAGGAYEELLKIMGASFGASKIKGLLQSNLNEAGSREALTFRLKTVLNGGDSKELEALANSLARRGVDTYNNLIESSYALLSAGISEQETKVGTEIAAKVAALTQGHSGDIANVMATVANDFRLPMQEIGDVLAKTQNIFQIKDFHQLEEGLKYVAAAASSLNIPLTQTNALLGTLNNAGMAGSMAGTGVAGILSSVSKASGGLGIEVPKASDGSLDIANWIAMVQDKVQNIVGDDSLKQFDVLLSLFGDAGARSFLVLAGRIHEVKENLHKLQDADGFVDDKMKDYYELYNTKTLSLSQSLSQLSATMGNLLLPAVVLGIKGLAAFVNITNDLIVKFPALGWVIYGVVGFLGLLATRMLIIRGLLIANAIFGFGRAFVFLGSAIKAVTLAFRVLTVAMVSNPIGFLATALAIAAVLLIQNWDKVKSWFVDFFNWFKATAFFKWIEKGISFGKGLFSSREESNIKIDNKGVDSVKGAGINSNSSSNTNNNNQVYNINISGGGKSSQDIVNSVSKMLENHEKVSMQGG